MANVLKRLATSVSVWVTLLSALIAVFIRFRLPFKPNNISLQQQQRLFTSEELALYNGTDDSLPILLGIVGSVFDVTKGKSHYGVGGGYNHFAGRFAPMDCIVLCDLSSIL
uniref:Uncharacterized protein n=1 Tax=Rhizophora mucronata TaxID=61149 RepID=A0A2P2KUR7_RHIMU